MIKPMLAHIYEPKRFKLPAYVQPKLNGIRGLTQRGRYLSRDGVEWNPEIVNHVASILTHVDNVLDGEWYRHGWSLQKINGAIAVNRAVRVANTNEIQFHIFDTVNYDAPFIERWWQAKQIVEGTNNPNLKLVPCHEVESITEVDSWFNYYRQQGYEGVMVRMGTGGYTKPSVRGLSDQDNRCWTMLKRKGWLDDEFEIIGVQEGKETDKGSKYVGTLGALVCRARNGKEFTVGSGPSDTERDEWWNNPPVGRKAKVRYLMLSDEGVPLNPTLEMVI